MKQLRGLDRIREIPFQYCETYQDEKLTMDYDFAMLILPFTGVGITAVGPNGEDHTDRLLNKQINDYKKYSDFGRDINFTIEKWESSNISLNI